MFGNPLMTIVTERGVSVKNIWGDSDLAPGQPLYLVKTRAIVKDAELRSGSWIGLRKKTNTARTYSQQRTRDYSVMKDWLHHQNESMPLGFPKSLIAKPEQITVPSHRFFYGNDNGIPSSTANASEDIRISRGSVNREKWMRQPLMNRLKHSWNDYGEWITLPISGFSIDKINAWFGYPDVFGNWCNPDIHCMGTVKYAPKERSQMVDHVKTVVSGINSTTGAPETRPNVLQAASMLNDIMISVTQKSKTKMFI